jgi:hypothetical protein
LNDCSGNGLTSTTGALNVNLVNANVNVSQNNIDVSTDNIKAHVVDFSGNAITSANNRLNINQNALSHSTDSVVSRLNDGAGNSLTSTGNALDVNIVNANVTVSQNNLDISTDNIKAHVVDTAGNDISSTNNALNVQVMNEFLGVNVAGLSFQNVGLIMADRDEVILNNGYTSIGSSTYLSKLLGYRSTVATTGSDITTNTSDAFNYGLLSGGVAVYAKSSSANDTNSAGTGARMLLIRGVDNAGDDGTATLLMNGTTTTGVADVAFTKINYIQVMSAGSSKTNEGKITL